MKSASAMSMEIRAKKKAMQDNESIIDSGGSPSMDLQDEELMKRNDMTKEIGLDYNEPSDEHDEDPMAKEENIEEKENEPHEEDKPEEMELEHYASGGMVGGRGAIAGGSVPKKTELAKVNGYADGGETEEPEDVEKELYNMPNHPEKQMDKMEDPMKAKRMARLRMKMR